MAGRLLISLCALTRTTDLVARRRGTGSFLPALFTLRYANMGGLDREVFARQLKQCRSFADVGWTSYWDAVADAHLDAAAQRLEKLGGPSATALRELMDVRDDDMEDDVRATQRRDAAAASLISAVAGAAPILAEHGPQPAPGLVERLASDFRGVDELEPAQAGVAAVAIDELVKAITYLQVSAFPGTTPLRMRAYHRSRRLFDVLVAALDAGLDTTVERFSVSVDGELVRGYAVLPPGEKPVASVLVTNGLEGTVQELLIPMMRYRGSGLGVVVMEMPGSYAYTRPMSADSIRIYDQAIEHLAMHPRVDEQRIGFVGVSFGGHWAVRLAARNPRLRCAVACGAPTDHSFGPSLGIPHIIFEALAKVTGANNPIQLGRRLHALSLRGEYSKITIPLLVINGDNDTLLSTQDSIDLVAGAQHGELVLYPDDDHCAMGHYREWLDYSQQWLGRHLAPEVTV